MLLLLLLSVEFLLNFFFLSIFIWWFIFLILFMIKEYLILFWFTQTQKFKHKQHKQQFFFFMNFYSRDLFFKKNKNKWHFEWIPFVILGSKLRSFSSSSSFFRISYSWVQLLEYFIFIPSLKNFTFFSLLYSALHHFSFYSIILLTSVRCSVMFSRVM